MNRKITLIINSILALMFSGCTPSVKVEAPDKPITVNLNVNVEHKLKVEIDKDIDAAIKNNPDLF